jgi:hypothetical protein
MPKNAAEERAKAESQFALTGFFKDSLCALESIHKCGRYVS